MKSKTSFFEPCGLFSRTLFLKHLGRYWPLWGLASFFGALFPLSLILMRLRGIFDSTALEFTQAYYSALAYGVPVVMLCYCILCAMAVWNWLYDPRAVGMMHTLPIRREGLFVTSFLSGLVMTAIPCVAMAVLAIALSLLCGAFQGGPLLLTVCGVAAEGFFYFASATAAAFLTGNVFALPVLYFLFHFLEPALDIGISTFASNLIFGLEQNFYAGDLEFLSPTVYLMKHVVPDVHYAEISARNPDGSMYVRHVVDAVSIANFWIVLAYALVGAALLAAAWALYRLRRSESARDVIAIGWGKPVFKAGIAGLCALGGGQLLYFLFFYDLMDEQYRHYALIPLIVCLSVAGLIGYYAAAMLLTKSLRVFRGSLRGVGIVVACCAAFSSLVYFDVFGVERRIPSDDQIRMATLDVGGNHYDLYPAGTVLYPDGGEPDDTELLAGLRTVHQSILDHKDEIRSFSYADYYYDADDPTPEDERVRTGHAYVRISYMLRNGLTVYRGYGLDMLSTNMDDPDSWEYALDRFVNGTGMRNKRLHAGDPSYRLSGGNLFVDRSQRGGDLSSREAEQILAALSADAGEGTWGTYDWFYSWGEHYAIDLTLEFERLDRWSVAGYGEWDHISIVIRPGMRHTIDALKDLGYVTDDDLITWDELDRLRDRDHAASMYEYSDEYVEGRTLTIPATTPVPAATAESDGISEGSVDSGGVPASDGSSDGSVDSGGIPANGGDADMVPNSAPPLTEIVSGSVGNG